MDAPAQTPARPWRGALRWIGHFLVRWVPIMVALQVSFEVLLRSDWFLRNPDLDPGQAATLIVFVPAGLWAVADGYRLVPTGQAVALWAAVGAAMVLAAHLFTAVLGVTQGMALTVVEAARWAGAALDLAVLHAVPAGMLVLLGAGLHHLRSTRATRQSTTPSEGGR